jgi:L1 cell adhesion molecule like protein
MAADLLGTVAKIVELALSIKKAVETVRHNEQECRVIEKRVGRVSRIVGGFKEEVTAATNGKLSADLEDLVEALDGALKLVTECQRRRLRRFIAPGGIAEKLRRVQIEISDATMTILLALNVRGTVILENIESGVHRPPPPPQVPYASAAAVRLDLPLGLYYSYYSFRSIPKYFVRKLLFFIKQNNRNFRII